jgi:hypothetical protein
MRDSGILVKVSYGYRQEGEWRGNGGGMSGLVVLKAHKVNKVLPPGYRVDHDPEVAVLRRPDGSVVA